MFNFMFGSLLLILSIFFFVLALSIFSLLTIFVKKYRNALTCYIGIVMILLLIWTTGYTWSWLLYYFRVTLSSIIFAVFIMPAIIVGLGLLFSKVGDRLLNFMLVPTNEDEDPENNDQDNLEDDEKNNDFADKVVDAYYTENVDEQSDTNTETLEETGKVEQLKLEEIMSPYEDAKLLVINSQKVSIDLLVKNLGVTRSEAKDLIDQLEENGVISPRAKNNSRKVLIK